MANKVILPRDEWTITKCGESAFIGFVMFITKENP